jgi:hypothetical protein
MPTSYATLQIECQTPLLLSEARALLDAMQGTYDGLTAFNTIAGDLINAYRLQERYNPFPFPFYQPVLPTQQVPAAQVVGADQVILLQRVELSSPGFWEFLGLLNPLDQIRRYLNDRHQRKLDLLNLPVQQQTAQLVNENIELQNEKLAIENLRELLAVGREAGIPTTQTTAMYRQYVSNNLRTLGDTVERLNATAGELVEVTPPAGTSDAGES